MKFASLGSGSEGNALLISSGSESASASALASGAEVRSSEDNTTIMLDCGFTLRETERRLQRLAVDPSSLAGILVTHEHSDHVGGVFKLARRYQLPVWLSYGTWQAVKDAASGVDVRFCRDNMPITIGALEVLPYTVPHDAREPLQYVVRNGRLQLGVLTDVGHPTAHLVASLAACDALLLECNHDVRLLAESRYPPSLKSRIGGPFGHLSNVHAAQILASLDRSRLNKIVGAHLSQQNNTPELARSAIDSVVEAEQIDVLIACQEEGFGWLACDRQL